MVALRNNERLFGDAALNTVSREREGGRERERERDTFTWLGTRIFVYTVRGEEGLFLCTRWPGLSRKCKTKQEGS